MAAVGQELASVTRGALKDGFCVRTGALKSGAKKVAKGVAKRNKVIKAIKVMRVIEAIRRSEALRVFQGIKVIQAIGEIAALR